jgi:hypothetical protein
MSASKSKPGVPGVRKSRCRKASVLTELVSTGYDRDRKDYAVNSIRTKRFFPRTRRNSRSAVSQRHRGFHVSV